MADAWSDEELAAIAAAQELEIRTTLADGRVRKWTPIWVVVVESEVFVRTWRRRDTGWFGDAIRTPHARIRVPGVEVDVTVEDVGAGPSDLQHDVDAAYRSKYGGSGTGGMLTDESVATTLRLDRQG